MDTQKKSQSQGSDNVGAETTIAVEEVNRVLSSLAPLYSTGAEKATRDAADTVAHILSTGTFSPADVATLATVEEVLQEGAERIEVVREELAELFSRL